MPQEPDTENPSPNKPRLKLRRSGDESPPAKADEQGPAVGSTGPQRPEPAAQVPSPSTSAPTPDPSPAAPIADSTAPETEPEPIGAPGALMREALKKEQQQAAKPTSIPSHEKSPNLALIAAKLVILLILFGGGLSLVVHALLNFGGDDSAAAPAPARTTHSPAADAQPRPAQPSPAPKSTIIILDENEVLPGIPIESEAPITAPTPPPERPAETPSIPATAVPTPPAQPAQTTPPAQTAAQPDDPAVKRWLDQVAISGIAGSRMILNQKIFSLGDTVNPELGIRWTDVDPQQKILTFSDKNNNRYTLRY